MRKVKITAIDDAVRALWEARSEFDGDPVNAIAAVHGYLGERAQTDYGVPDLENPCIPTNPRRDAYNRGRLLKVWSSLTTHT